MILFGQLWKIDDGPGWIAEVPLLNMVAQADTKEEIPHAFEEAIKMLLQDSSIEVFVKIDEDCLLITANDPEKLVPLLIESYCAREEVQSHR